MKGLAFCDDWAEKFAALRLDDLSLSEHLEFQQHLLECSMCSAVYATINLMQACIRALLQGGPLSSLIPEFKQIRYNNKHDSDMSYRASEGTIRTEALSAVNHPRHRSNAPGINDACLIQISVRCANKFIEVTLEELESAELAVEDGVGTVLLDLFESVAIDEVSISFTFDSSTERQMCAIRIDIWCPFRPVSLNPQELRNIEFAVEDRVSSVLVELFGEVIVDDVRIANFTNPCQDAPAS
jgi:hypothetical protein